ncbi:MAG: PilX N-terminal domain-containing pilus assembly protein [Pseudomonadales bacterium]|jgi:type IV pilus assembly protein PilX|nr:PilX N-terminal domain-containing pilus assembly protein [Pseudomonadales bacterium]
MRTSRRFAPGARPGRRQEGVALFIALVVLLIITVLGISGLQTTTLEERMAASARDRDIAFQSAEAALAEGELFVQALGVTDLATFDLDTDGLYRPRGGNDDDWWETVDWVGDASLPTVADAIAGVAAQPRYIVEYKTRILAEDDTLNISNVGASVGAPTDVFRITSFGTGGSARANVMLQASYGVIVSTGP